MKKSVDVLIVGAGPVGLLLASELSRDGVDVLLIDRMATRSFFCKALGVTPRTLEIFEDLGIAQDAIDSGVWLQGVSSFTDGAPGPSMDVPTDLPFGSLSLAQFDTERLLEACLHRCGGRVSYGHTLMTFSEHAEGVQAQVQSPDGQTQTIESRWLVGCDGAHSKVRATLGFDFSGGQYPQTFALADLEVQWNLPRGRMYRFNTGTGRTLAAVPVHGSPRRYRLSTIVPDGALTKTPGAEEQSLTLTLEQAIDLMTPLLPEGTALSSLHWSSIYRVSHRIVPAYSKGRVFLAGDAAHLHPPVGGQGMNTGIQDAHNLAWKLALTSRGHAAQALLDSYSIERHAVGLDVVENTSRALNEVLAQRTQLPGMRETQLLISYRGSPIVRDERANAGTAPLAAGDHVPNPAQLRRPFVGHAFRLHERLGRVRHTLLGYVDDEPAKAETIAQMLDVLRTAFGADLNGCAIAPPERLPKERDDLPMLIDAGGEFAAAFDASIGTAWLIRPDGYIGWCSAAPSVTELQCFLEMLVQA